MTYNEVTLHKDTKFITKYGTTSEGKYPSVLYMRSKAKITPLEKKASYEDEITNVKEQFMEYVGEQIRKSKQFGNSHLCNIDISSKSVSHGKVSFLRYDVYLKPIKRQTFEASKKQFTVFSTRLDKKLDKLLNKYGMACV